MITPTQKPLEQDEIVRRVNNELKEDVEETLDYLVDLVITTQDVNDAENFFAQRIKQLIHQDFHETDKQFNKKIKSLFRLIYVHQKNIEEKTKSRAFIKPPISRVENDKMKRAPVKLSTTKEVSPLSHPSMFQHYSTGNFKGSPSRLRQSSFRLLSSISSLLYTRNSTKMQQKSEEQRNYILYKKSV